jgi:hypothetical protein
MNHRPQALSVAVACALLTPDSVLAWGKVGHEIIGDIANRRLSSEAAREVRALLSLEGNTTLAEIAYWADDIKLQRPDTKTWHFVDIPISAATYDAGRDCKNDLCIVAKLTEYGEVLRSKSGLLPVPRTPS